MFSAFRNCPRSAIQAQEEVLDPCCEPYAQPSPSLAFFTGSKKAWDWISNGSLQSHSLAAFSCRGGQSVIIHFCIDKLSELQIPLVGKLTSAFTSILMRRAGNSPSAKTSETDSGHGRLTGSCCPLRNCFQEDTLFNLHLQSKNMIYLLTLF